MIMKSMYLKMGKVLNSLNDDTIAAIAGGIAEAFYGTIPDDIRKKGRLILDSGLKRVLDEFEAKYCKG